MEPLRILGIVVLVVGVLMLGFGLNATDAPADQISETFTGKYTDRTMWYLIAGAAGIVAGGLLAMFGKRAA